MDIPVPQIVRNAKIVVKLGYQPRRGHVYPIHCVKEKVSLDQ